MKKVLRIKSRVHDRKTGKIISEEITDEVPDITREELNRPLAEIIYKRIMEKKKKTKNKGGISSWRLLKLNLKMSKHFFIPVITIINF